VTVSREIPLTFLANGSADPVMVNHDDDEPCFGCACCALWTRTVDQLRDAMRHHESDCHIMGPRQDPDCLVCELMAGAADG